MKQIFLILIIFTFSVILNGQSISSHIEVTKVYSQNEQYYLHSIPFDNEEPSLKGKTSIYKTGETTALYVLNRAFDSVSRYENNLALSNNGEVIISVISWSAYEEIEGLKSISIYKNGELIKSFTKAEITGCDIEKERCDLVYSSEIIDREKSGWENGSYKKVFVEGASEKEIFLYDFCSV